jgi:hypothetical protein
MRSRDERASNSLKLATFVGPTDARKANAKLQEVEPTDAVFGLRRPAKISTRSLSEMIRKVGGQTDRLRVLRRIGLEKQTRLTKVH